MKQLLESFAGANWRTTLTGIGTAIMGVLAALSVAPYELGPVATMLPPEWKPFILKVSLVSAFILHIIKSVNGKDRQVVGNGTMEEPNRVPAPLGGTRLIPLVALLLVPVLFIGCLSTNTGDIAVDRRHAVENLLLQKAASVLGQVAVATLSSAALHEMSGSRVDWQHEAAQAAWAQAPSVFTGADLQDFINAATLNHVPATAAAAARQFDTAAPKTPAAAQATVNAIADTLSATAILAQK